MDKGANKSFIYFLNNLSYWGPGRRKNNVKSVNGTFPGVLLNC